MISRFRVRCTFMAIATVAVVLLGGPTAAAQTSPWQSAELGNIFDVGKSVELTLKSDAKTVTWTVFDFWHRQVESGSSEVIDGVATIRPKVTDVGYYLLHAQPADKYTSFAIVRPHVSKDPENSPFGAMTHFAQGMNPQVLPTLKRIGIESIRD